MRAVADLAHGVPRVVDGRAEASLGQLRDEPLDRLALVSREARDRDEAVDEVDVGLLRPHASAFADAARTRSTWSAVMTSGGR